MMLRLLYCSLNPKAYDESWSVVGDITQKVRALMQGTSKATSFHLVQS